MKINRRDFLKHSSCTVATLATGIGLKSALAQTEQFPVIKPKKVIILAFDGMDPRLCEKMMAEGRLPHLDRLRKQGGYSTLGTSIPPQSPVAWANFINGAGPGSHGIFDFIHRDPERQAYPFYAAAKTVAGQGYLELGDHKMQLNFWPFNHKPAQTILKRQGTPFWDYLDRAGVDSTFYCLPSNYPPSPSLYGHHRCVAGMGTPDLLGTYGTYQHFAEDGPEETQTEGGGKRSKIYFEGETSLPVTLLGPKNTILKEPVPTQIDFIVHRDSQARAAVIEIQNQTVVLNEGQWSEWLKLDFELSMPALMPDKKLSGICRFYVQEIAPNFRLYATPINTDPSDPAIKLTEPEQFSREISQKLGLYYTTGFQEDHKALSNEVFTEDEYIVQSEKVLQERLELLDHAVSNYDDGLLFFYFSSTDMQAHMFWWDSDAKHPIRSTPEAKKYFQHLQKLYSRMDAVVGDMLKRYGSTAHIMIMSDHGFANFGRQFNLNTWLRNNGYLGPPDCTAVLENAEWSQSRAFGLGINSLYLNLKGRERYGIVEPGREKEQLLDELTAKLKALRDKDGRQVIRAVHRTEQAYSGPALHYAPDLVIGYSRDFRASWKTCLGNITDEVLLDNTSAWSADHCMDASEVPGVLFSNQPIAAANPSLVDLAPSVLTKFGLPIPSEMTGRNIIKT